MGTFGEVPIGGRFYLLENGVAVVFIKIDSDSAKDTDSTDIVLLDECEEIQHCYD